MWFQCLSPHFQGHSNQYRIDHQFQLLVSAILHSKMAAVLNIIACNLGSKEDRMQLQWLTAHFQGQRIQWRHYFKHLVLEHLAWNSETIVDEFEDGFNGPFYTYLRIHFMFTFCDICLNYAICRSGNLATHLLVDRRETVRTFERLNKNVSLSSCNVCLVVLVSHCRPPV